MRINYTLNQRTVHRAFPKRPRGRRSLYVFDRDLRPFFLKVCWSGNRTYFVRITGKLGRSDIRLGAVDEITAAEARARALEEIRKAQRQADAGPLVRDFAKEFQRRVERRWKPSTRATNRDCVAKQILPFFGGMRVAEIEPSDVRRWFDGMSERPATANRSLPVLSVMMKQAELWDLRPAGSNPCRNMRRYRLRPRERFLSVAELKRLGFVLDHAEDTQAAAVIRLLLLTGARSSEITDLRWEWIRGTRAVLPDSKSGPKSIQLPPPAQAVLDGLPRTSPYVFPEPIGTGPMRNLKSRWPKLRGLAGLDDVRVHDLRHTYASHAIMSGLDLYTVGRLLGHADTGSTERYAHLADEHVVAAAGRIERIVAGGMTAGSDGTAGNMTDAETNNAE